MEVLPGSFLERYHAALKRRKIVIEGVASEATLRALLSLDEAALESHYGRPVVAYVVPAEFLDFDADYLVLPNGRVFAFDWVTPSVSAIRSQAVADSIRAWLGLLVRHGKKTDINAAIRDRLTKRA